MSGENENDTATETATETAAAVEDAPLANLGKELDKDTASGDEKQPSGENAAGEADAKAPETAGEAADKDAKKDEFDIDVLAHAADMGISEEDARAFGSKQALERALVVLDKRIPALLESLPQPAGETPPSKEAAKPEAGKPAPGAFAVDIPDEGDYDPAIVKNLKGAAEEINRLNARLAEFDSLKAEVATMREAQQEREARETRQSLDRLFDTLGDEYRVFVGKGSSETMDRNGEHYKARSEIALTMDQIEAWYRLRNQSPPDGDRLFKRAVSVVYGDKTQELARKALLAKADKRGKQTLSRASASDSAAGLTPEQRAIKLHDDFLRKAGE